MVDTFKSYFVQWAIAFSVAAIIGVTTWTISMSSLKTKFETLETRFLKHIEDFTDLQEALENIRIKQAEYGKTLESNMQLFKKIDTRLDLHTERITAHSDRPWHNPAGIEIGKLGQALVTVKEDQESSDKLIEKIKDKMDLGERYTAEMANTDQQRVLRMLDKLEEDMQKDFMKQEGQIARVENLMLREIDGLKDVITTHINIHHKRDSMLHGHKQ